MIFLKKFLELLFPTTCVACRKKEEQSICLECLSTIPFLRNSSKKGIVSAFSYKHTVVKKSLWAGKFQGNKKALILLSDKAYDLLCDELQEQYLGLSPQEIILVPVPLHTKRLRKRGFNQAEIICSALEKKSPDLFSVDTTHVMKTLHTRPQSSIQTKEERIKNLAHCFAIRDGSFFHNKHVIVVDDITTTGTTVYEIMKLIKRYGPKNIQGFTLAQ